MPRTNSVGSIQIQDFEVLPEFEDYSTIADLVCNVTSENLNQVAETINQYIKEGRITKIFASHLINVQSYCIKKKKTILKNLLILIGAADCPKAPNMIKFHLTLILEQAKLLIPQKIKELLLNDDAEQFAGLDEFDELINTYILAEAVKYSAIKIIKLLLLSDKELKFTEEMVFPAILASNIEIIKMIHEQLQNFPTDKLGFTLVNNNNEIFDWIYQNVEKEIDPFWAFFGCNFRALSYCLVNNIKHYDMHYTFEVTELQHLLNFAIYFQSIDLVEKLIKLGVSPYDTTLRQPVHGSPLNFAIKTDQDEIVHYLLDNYKINVNAKSNNPNYCYPIIVALAYGNEKIARYLVEYGAKLNVSGKINGPTLTPIIIAIESQNLEMVKFLVEHGAKVNAIQAKTQGDCRYPIIAAVKANSMEIVQYLLENGANTRVKEI